MLKVSQIDAGQRNCCRAYYVMFMGISGFTWRSTKVACIFKIVCALHVLFGTKCMTFSVTVLVCSHAYN